MFVLHLVLVWCKYGCYHWSLQECIEVSALTWIWAIYQTYNIIFFIKDPEKTYVWNNTSFFTFILLSKLNPIFSQWLKQNIQLLIIYSLMLSIDQTFRHWILFKNGSIDLGRFSSNVSICGRMWWKQYITIIFADNRTISRNCFCFFIRFLFVSKLFLHNFPMEILWKSLAHVFKLLAVNFASWDSCLQLVRNCSSIGWWLDGLVMLQLK